MGTKIIYFSALDQNITYLELTVAAANDDDDLDEQCRYCVVFVCKLRLSFLNVLLSLTCLHV